YCPSVLGGNTVNGSTYSLNKGPGVLGGDTCDGNTKDMFIVYGGDLERELKVTGYTDVGFETNKDDRKSQTEAEYIAASEATMEAVWIRKFISRLGVVPINKEPMKIYCDNTCAIIITNEPGVQRGARRY
ncbi:hypothetical protein Tco_1446351, partial [Tanacetum coccineum]